MRPLDAVPPAVTREVESPLTDKHAGGRILLGRITGVVGLKGWVKVHSDTRPRNNIVKYPLWWLMQSSQWRQMKVVDGKPQGKTIVAKLEGIDTPESASALIGASIAIDRSAMPPTEHGEYYWADLTGMKVTTVDGNLIGSVQRLFETGANDVVVIADERDAAEGDKNSTEKGPEKSAGKGASKRSREILVPWLVPDVITEVDMDNRTIVIDWDPDF